MAKIDENIKIVMLKGETGSNIDNIEKTSSSGRIDTYTVTLTNGETTKFNVTNGEKGEQGEKGDTGASITASGLFNLGVDSDGNLWVYYTDPNYPPTFEYDSATGNLYYVTEG